VNVYRVVTSPSAEKELEKLPKKAVQRITRAIDELAENPRPRGCLKLQGEENTYRIRVGVYRVVYEIRDKEIVVLVLRIRHRKDAY
jgi:mRNA interferase RelE/StbE